jgi:hypothetical protein
MPDENLAKLAEPNGNERREQNTRKSKQDKPRRKRANRNGTGDVGVQRISNLNGGSVIDFSHFSVSADGPRIYSASDSVTSLYATEVHFQPLGIIGSEIEPWYLERVASHVRNAYNQKSSERSPFTASEQLSYLRSVASAYRVAVSAQNIVDFFTANQARFPGLYEDVMPGLGVDSIHSKLASLKAALSGHYLPAGMMQVIDWWYSNRIVDDNNHMLVMPPETNIATTLISDVVTNMGVVLLPLINGTLDENQEKFRRVYDVGIGEAKAAVKVTGKTSQFDAHFHDILAQRFWKTAGTFAYPTVSNRETEFVVYNSQKTLSNFQAAMMTVEVGAVSGSGQAEGFVQDSADRGFYGFYGTAGGWIDQDQLKSMFGMWNFPFASSAATSIYTLPRPVYRFNLTQNTLRQSQLNLLIKMMSFGDFGKGAYTTEAASLKA